jgi:16S rRNA (uracil1498-N3)-methyltransferase
VSAPQFFVDELSEGASVTLRDEDAHHARRALRLRPGDEVSLADGAGAVGIGVLAGDTPAATVRVREVRHVERPTPPVYVALAPPKGDRLAWAVQKLTEVGADRIALVDCERSVRRWTDDREGNARRRLEAVAREAAMQSRRPFIPEIEGPWPFERALQAEGRDDRIAVLWEGASEPLARALDEAPGAVRLVVGPEGGFTEGEVAAARDAGASLASRGEGILRTETAALAAAVVALHRLGRLG